MQRLLLSHAAHRGELASHWNSVGSLTQMKFLNMEGKVISCELQPPRLTRRQLTEYLSVQLQQFGAIWTPRLVKCLSAALKDVELFL